MKYRQELGIYEFTDETKSQPTWQEDGCRGLVNSQRHYFAVLKVCDEYCEGYMFSTKRYDNNIAMRLGDFKPGGFPFRKDTTTYFLTVPIKKAHYLETKSEPVGWLTVDGKAHIEQYRSGPALTWVEYVEKYCQGK